MRESGKDESELGEHGDLYLEHEEIYIAIRKNYIDCHYFDYVL